MINRFDSRQRCVLLGAAICAMGMVTAKPVLAADLDIGPEGPGGYLQQPYPYHPYPPQSQAYPLPYAGPLYYGRPAVGLPYRPHVWADPGVGYRDEPFGYGRPHYFYRPYAEYHAYVQRPPAPIPYGYAAYPRELPAEDLVAEEMPDYGWSPQPRW